MTFSVKKCMPLTLEITQALKQGMSKRFIMGHKNLRIYTERS